MKKDIGLGIEKTKEKACGDNKCPFCGDLNVKKEFLTGTVLKTDVHRSATIMWERKYKIPKYERIERRKSQIHVHNSPCINAKKGDKVLVAKTRPISKTKTFAIIKILEIK